MLQLSPSVPAEAIAPAAQAAPQAAGGDSGETFGEAVARLLDEGASAGEPARTEKTTVDGEGVTAAPESSDGDQDAAALLMAMAPAWSVCILPATPPVQTGETLASAPSEDAVGEPIAPDAPNAEEAVVSSLSSLPLVSAVQTAVPSGQQQAPVEPAPVSAAAADLTSGATTSPVGGPLTSPSSAVDRPTDGSPRLAVPPLVGAPANTTVAAPSVEGAAAEAGAERTPSAAIIREAGPDALDGASIPADASPVPSPVPTPNVVDPRPVRLSPQGARFVAALAGGMRGASIASVAVGRGATEAGHIVIDAAVKSASSSPSHASTPAAATRGLEVSLPEHAAPNVVREVATKFLSFDATAATLTAQAQQVTAASESGLGTSRDASAWMRSQVVYDLKAAANPGVTSATDASALAQSLAAAQAQAATALASTPTMAAVAPTGSLPDGAHAAMGDVPTQIVRQMQMQWRDGVGEAKLTLTPESLGEVTVTMKVDRGVVTASVRAENPVTMEWIRSHQHELRDALDAQGLKLDHLEVSVDPDDRRRRDEAQQQQQQARKTRTGVADGARFELLV